MPSITSWTRLEPRARSEDMRTSLQARIHDPLWLLARQWQFGEFQGEDAGSPVVARLRAECSRLTRYHPGPLTNGVTAFGQTYDSKSLPLETLVERESIHHEVDAHPNGRLAAEAGLHFLRLLEASGTGTYRAVYLARYALEPPSDEERRLLDVNSIRFLDVMAHRVPDGGRLYADLRAALRPPDGEPGTLPAEPVIAEADRENVTKAAKTWLDWYETLFSEPATEESPWIPERMEYEFAVSARTADGELVLAAPEYVEGHLDWYSFNVYPNASLGAGEGDGEPEIIRTLIPAPVSYRGMPASRWWEFEDAQVDFGAVEAGPEDLMRLLFAEFALIYGNDWFFIPFEVEVGSICRIRSLVVTDTFGERTLIRPYTQVDGPDSPWRMFCPCLDRRASSSNAEPPDDVFLLSPALAASLQGSPVEEVLFLRDEIANMAWAVERVVESPSGRPLDRFEAFLEQRRREENERGDLPQQSTAPLVYRLATSVPDHWIPLIPVQEQDKRSIRLKRGKMLRGRAEDLVTPEPQGRILELRRELSLFEEEVPRTGALVTRAYQYARWIDGSTHIWIGRRKQPGRGEGWSGLRFDIVETV